MKDLIHDLPLLNYISLSLIIIHYFQQIIRAIFGKTLAQFKIKE